MNWPARWPHASNDWLEEREPMTTAETPDYRVLLQRSLDALDTMEAKLDAAERRVHEPIAVVGMGLRFPGAAHDPDTFWELLTSGRDAIIEIPQERWDREAMFDPNPDAPGKSYTRWGGFVDGVDEFDATFFGISPREAVSMDPQQRMLLEVVWEALEHAGIPPSSLAGTATGVFTGIIGTEYADLALRGGIMAEADAYFASGVARSVAAGRLAYVFDLRGPALAVDTSCSSSLVATHLACQALRSGDCDAALAGGVSVLLSPDAFILTSRARMMSFEGRCKTFDAHADGYVRSEGCAVLVLKRLSDALAASDRILGTIRGTALNHDGRTNGLTAPNAAAQEAVIRAALADGGVDPLEVGFVECHGTGTTLGDPIEIRALQAVFGPGRPADRPLRVQSVKTNIGHLEAGAGIAGLCKLLLALGRGSLPAHLHLAEPNPYIPWNDIDVVAEPGPWDWAENGGRRRIGGVSSFGFSGTNVHMVVEQAPDPTPAPAVPKRRSRVYPVSARTPDALRRVAAAHARHLERIDDEQWPDAAATATTGRGHLEERLAVVASTPAHAAAALAGAAADETSADVLRGRPAGDYDGLVMLFTGQGSQRPGMGRQLYDTEPAFRTVIDECAEILFDVGGLDLRSVMFDAEPAPGGLTVNDTRCAQPAIFAYEVAMAALWRSWGIQPAAVLGHSIGELAAAHVAGVMSLRDALVVVDARGRLMQALPRDGGMAAVFTDAATVEAAIADRTNVLSVAALNGPRHVVLSGRLDALAEVRGALEAGGTRVVPLEVSHAFHSPLMEPMLDEFEEIVRSVTLRDPGIELISTRTAEVAEPGLLTDPRYWRDHVREPVRFGAAFRYALDIGHRSFLEVGPAPALTTMARAHELPEVVAFYPSGRRSDDEAVELQRTVGAAYVGGLPLDWHAYEGGVRRRVVDLPTYPFEPRRHWHPRVRPDLPAVGARAVDEDLPLLGRRVRSPRLVEQVFERELSASSPAWMADHVIYRKTIVPATAHAELMRRAVAGSGGSGDIVDLRIEEPLVLEPGTPVVVQTIVADDDATVEVVSADGDRWRRHAAGRVDPLAASATDDALTLGDIEGASRRCTQVVVAEEYYAALSRLGADYGPSFQVIEHAARCEGEVVATLRAPASDEPDELHPALADGCLQALGLAMPGAEDLSSTDGDAYMPVGIERWHVDGPASDILTVHGRLRPADISAAGAAVVMGDLQLFDDAGRLVAAMTGVRFKRAPRTALATPGADEEWLYVPTWVPAPPSQAAAASLEGQWIVVGRRGATRALAERIRLGDASAIELDVDPEITATEVAALVDAALAGATGVVVVLPLRPGAPSFDATFAARLATQAAAGEHSPSIAFVSTRAMAVSPGDRVDNPQQAAVWGAVRVARAELVHLSCRLVDVDPGAEADVVRELLAVRDEPEVAWRDGVRFAARLARAADVDGLALPEGPYELTITERGRLDGLQLVAQPELEPGPGQVLVDVRATGLNFRDVLDVLGRYPGAAAGLGGECAGVVTAVGPGVERVRPGDRVMAVVSSGFATRCLVSEEMVVRQPAGWTDVQAATVPIAFLTAAYSLNHLGHMQAGERVLVHAGAGGVGMAAVQLALAAGAEVFATAGSDAKRDALAAMGVRYVYDSRSVAFRDEILRDTAGRGVDLVLNSLAGETIAATMDVLAPTGRFLEIGMTDIWEPEAFAAAHPDAAYHVIYLGQVCLDEPGLIAGMLDALVAEFERGALRALPATCFDIRRSVSAFRYMAQARHMGKVVVTAAVGWNVAAAGTWIVTGGLGGLGLAVAAELAEGGATRLVLCSRRPASTEVAATLDELAACGVDVRAVALDVTDADAVARVVKDATADGTPLRGVVHAAGILDDALLRDLTEDRFEAVMAPKVSGALHLAAAVEPHQPDHFILFSAGAGLLGSPGQGNYAAANAALDALAHARRADGRSAQVVDWGPWTTVGMAARLGDDAIRRWEAQGIAGLDPSDGRRAFRSVVAGGEPQVAVMKLRWPALLHRFSKHGVPPLLRDLAQSEQRQHVTAGGQAPALDLVAELSSLELASRRDRVRQEVREQVLAVLGLAPRHPIDPRQGLTDIGMDSLMAVELSNRLSVLVQRTLPSTVAFEHPTIVELAAHLEEQLADRVDFPPASGTSTATSGGTPDDEAADDLGAGELAEALVKELEEAGY
jgi:acyl transferase domain-containing protein/D-arabinose 1-dehydrogenase-like Zn-dependent alcohol dehydrogenase